MAGNHTESKIIFVKRVVDNLLATMLYTTKDVIPA
jgi:hypothetical protein